MMTSKSKADTNNGKGSYIYHDFEWHENDEPHATRRKQILAKHPEIRELFKPEPLTCPIVLTLVSIQIAMCYFLSQAGWAAFFLGAYFVGGTINHTLNMAIHELSHNLCFETVWMNRLLGLIASLPSGIPSSNSFRRYHMKHHQYQGVDGIDVDIPSVNEVNWFRNRPERKIFFIFFQSFAYGLRPLFVHPLPVATFEVVNFFIQLFFDICMYQAFGVTALLYMYAGTLFGNGLHPSAGHYIAEHYTFLKGVETYSYYGPMNFFNLNVGYHNEHHDFPRVPWSRLPMIKKLAPEFYDNLPCHTSYLRVLYQYITDSSIGPFSRVKRRIAHSNLAADVNKEL